MSAVICKPERHELSPHYVLTESTISSPWCSNDPRPSPNFSHGREIKSGSGLGMRLANYHRELMWGTAEAAATHWRNLLPSVIPNLQFQIKTVLFYLMVCAFVIWFKYVKFLACFLVVHWGQCGRIEKQNCSMGWAVDNFLCQFLTYVAWDTGHSLDRCSL